MVVGGGTDCRIAELAVGDGYVHWLTWLTCVGNSFHHGRC